MKSICHRTPVKLFSMALTVTIKLSKWIDRITLRSVLYYENHRHSESHEQSPEMHVNFLLFNCSQHQLFLVGGSEDFILANVIHLETMECFWQNSPFRGKKQNNREEICLVEASDLLIWNHWSQLWFFRYHFIEYYFLQYVHFSAMFLLLSLCKFNAVWSINNIRTISIKGKHDPHNLWWFCKVLHKNYSTLTFKDYFQYTNHLQFD